MEDTRNVKGSDRKLSRMPQNGSDMHIHYGMMKQCRRLGSEGSVEMLTAIPSALITIFIVNWVVHSVLPGKLDKRTAWVLFMALITFCAVSVLVCDSAVFRNAVSAVSLLFALLSPPLVQNRVQKGQSLYLSSMIMGLITAAGTAIQWSIIAVAAGVFEINKIDLPVNIALLILCLAFSIKGTLARVFQRMLLLRRHMKAVLLSAVWVSALLANLFSWFFVTNSSLPGLSFMGILTAALIIVVGVMCPILITNSLSSSYYKDLSDVMDSQAKAQVQHYQALSKKREDIAGFKHDFNNLRLGVADSLRRGDTAGALAMLESGAQTIAPEVYAIRTGNFVLDALVADKQRAASAVGTQIEFKGAVPEGLLDPVDICAIFGNALDNAVEACAKCPASDGGAISVRAEYTNCILFVTITNPVMGDVRIVGNMAATTKDDVRLHGFGLQSIHRAAAKYSGNVQLSCDNGAFSLKVALDFNGR